MSDSATGTARRYARRLLDDLGHGEIAITPGREDHPARAWTDSGLQPTVIPVPLMACAQGVLMALGALSGQRDLGSAASRLAARRPAEGYAPASAISPGASCRLLETGDGAIALNLARDEDWALLPAWLEIETCADWEQMASSIRGRGTEELVDRGRLMGLPIAADSPPSQERVPWFEKYGSGIKRSATRPPRVVDLSALWAGPLCGQLLRRLGAEVTKLECEHRMDGARRGDARFFASLNEGKKELTLNLRSSKGVDSLRQLIAQADIVIEGSRPRALRQMGIDAEAMVAQQPGLTWISISGYGRGQAQADRVAFGDDAGVAAGLSNLLYQVTGRRLICGDALGDPLTGLHAALAAWSCWQTGGGQLLALSLVDVLTHAIQFDLPVGPAALKARQRAWEQLIECPREAA